jgi:hypothetical protein
MDILAAYTNKSPARERGLIQEMRMGVIPHSIST